MDVEQQQGTWSRWGSVRPGASGEGGTGTAAYEEWQASTALNRERALASDLSLSYNRRGNRRIHSSLSPSTQEKHGAAFIRQIHTFRTWHSRRVTPTGLI